MPDGAAKILVAIADAGAVVKKQSALDDQIKRSLRGQAVNTGIFSSLCLL
jgi:exoribonuclease R